MSFLKQSAVTLGTQILLMFIGVATGVVVARVLGPELKGQAALLGMLTEVLFMCGSLGLGSAFSFFIAKKRYPSQQIMTLAIVAALLLGVLVNALFYLSWPLHSAVWSGIPFKLVIISTALVFISLFSNYLVRIIVGYGKIYSMNIAGALKTILNFILVVLLVFSLHFGLNGVVYSLCLASMVEVAFLAIVLRKDIRPRFFWNGDFLRATFSYGVKAHALLIINFLNYRLDIFLLQYLTGDSSKVGYYSLAVGMAELMWLFPNSLVAPLFSGIAQSDTLDRSVITLRTCRWSLLFLSIVAVAGIFLGRPFIHLLYGVEYLPSFIPFLLLLPGVCLFPLFKLLIIDLSARGYPGYGTITSMIALVINVGANIILIPRYGGAGAAIATSLSYIVMAGLSVLFFVRISKHSVLELFTFDKQEIQYIQTAFLDKIKK